VNEVNIHIEPLIQEVEKGKEAEGMDLRIASKISEIARDTEGVLDCHSVEAHHVAGNVVVRMHCTVGPNMPVSRVHEIMDELEFKFRKAFPDISKVSIHPEPQGRN
jgi:divalent metal cation (Fe/Co/Zn/Cd) transporter